MRKNSGKTSVITLTLALVLSAGLMLTGCDGDKNTTEETTGAGTAVASTENVVRADEIDVGAAAETILGGIKFDDSLAMLDAEAVKYRYGFTEDITAAVYAGSGATAEEVAVFDAGTDEDGEALADDMKKYIEEQIVSYKNYVPAEVSRLEKAIIEREGRYVILCVTADTDSAKAVIEKALGR